MPDIQFIKIRNKDGLNCYVPYNQEAHDLDKRTGQSEIIHGDFKKLRNAAFLKKFFVMLQFGFEYWEPGEVETPYGQPEKNFEQYRKNLVILAGYYKTVFNIDGTYKLEADSISFSKCDEIKFQKIYEAVFKVMHEKIFGGYSAFEVGEMLAEFEENFSYD